ncbi:MAG: hypothetical protein HDKAJFGB_01293 [Anaerolineae bacterium]|nr:hypothetical protein [Anaerolineae bacterium]
MQSGVDDAIADGGMFEGEVLLDFLFGQFGGRDIEERDGESGVGKVRCERAAHRAGTDDRDAANFIRHCKTPSWR